ncbi:MAG TPA: YbbR-like domain-containing protein, partial [Nannocystis sp.]
MLAWIGRGIVSHWLTKLSALVIALVFFVVTRDDVTRTFTIPLHVVPDPNRVLLTKLPEAVTVELHGSWARMSRLREQELGRAELNLSDARPGPLAIDPAAIVMPEGVIFRQIHYEKVDLRFDRIIERAVLVKADLRGNVHPDFEQTGVTVEPPRWRIRGGSGPVGEVQALQTEPIDLEGATGDLNVDVPLQNPRDDVDYTAVPPGELPRVKVTVAVRPRASERKLSAAVTWPTDQVAPAEIPTQVDVIVRGGVPDLRVLDAALSPPLVAVARRDKPTAEFPDGSVAFTVQFTEAVPPEVQGRL